MEQQTNNYAAYALVVQDEPLIRVYACSILMDAGCRTLDAGNTDEALRLLQMHEPTIRLLFTDVQMPGTDNGFVLAHRCNVQWPHVDILIASGHVAPQGWFSGAMRTMNCMMMSIVAVDPNGDGGLSPLLCDQRSIPVHQSCSDT